MTLGQRISAYRKMLKISQEELGARLNVSRQAVSKWENDLAVPDMTNLLGLAREFGVSVAELTETPEGTPAQGEPSMSETKAPSPTPRRRSRFVLAALVCIGLLLAVPYAFLAARRTDTTPTPDTADVQSDREAPSDFALTENGAPDDPDRQDFYQEPVDATRQVYIAWNQLVTSETLSAEERYTYRGQVFTGLPELNWREFGKLGTTDDLATSEAFADWLREQTFSDSELFWVQAGLGAEGLDGAYSENYCSLLAAALFRDPVGYAKQLPRAVEYSERVRANILGSTAYGADYYTSNCASAVEALDAVIDTDVLTETENDWAKLLRHYLATPNNGGYADSPDAPED